MRSSNDCLSASLAAVLWCAAAAAQEPPPPRAETPAPPTADQPAAAARPKDGKALLAAFAQMPGLQASYTEAKHISLLAVPLQSRGKLYFLRPGYLLRVVEAPEKSTLLITPKQLRLNGRDGEEVIDLQQSDHLRLFVTSLTRVFTGDEKTLDRDYRLDYVESRDDPAGWQLTLTPRGKPLSDMLARLVLHGSGMMVRQIEVVEPNGDRTVTTIADADPRRRFSAAEQAQLFGIRAGDKAP